ncbi:polysaccharide biosynthesis protein [mine drainage metagenome]|uniref:Polysaccharide biosynthesis protein n=2 Tax=mine drainage metagenome TaxID=410659 RepID=T1BUZ8_9ZZZZ
MSQTVLAFDIETIPDIELGSRLYGLEGLEGPEQFEALLQKRRQETSGSEFMPIHLHRVLVIGMVLKTPEGLRCFSLGANVSSERERVERFFSGLERWVPRLVTWNGTQFDLPVLNYRSLRYGISAARYWETGEHHPEFRYNNYLSRYHWRHTDLMDVLGGYQTGRNSVRLAEAAQLVGLPGKMGFAGDQVLGQYLNGQLERIDRYCETDALTTYLLYLRLEKMRGDLTADAFRTASGEVTAWLESQTDPYWHDFRSQWDLARWHVEDAP